MSQLLQGHQWCNWCYQRPGEKQLRLPPFFWGGERTGPKVKYCAIEYIGHTFGSLSKLCHTLFVLVSHIIFLVKLLCSPRVLRPGATAPLCPPLVTPLKATKWQNLFRFKPVKRFDKATLWIFIS